MRFWDASALVPLVVREAASPTALRLYKEDPQLLVWWGTEVEIVSSLARREREAALDHEGMGQAMVRLSALKHGWHEVIPSDKVRQAALRLLRVHPLRAMDALQLGAAVVASWGQSSQLAFVALDERLLVAAEREGFPVIRPTP